MSERRPGRSPRASAGDAPKGLPRKPSYHSHDGFLMPLGFPAEGLASGMAYVPDTDDVFVCTYPKCGTTWVQHIVYMLVRGRPIGPDESLTKRFPHLEEVGADAVRGLEKPRLIKTHLPLAMTPFAPEARYIVVARNPFDCAVSFYYHTRGFPQHYDFADGRFEEFFECFVRGEVDFGDYFDHLLPWHAAAGQGNVHFLTFESLKADPAPAIAGIARFLGGIAEQRASDPAELERVLEETSFERMRRDQQRWSSARPPGMPFVRGGRVGDWLDLFDAAQARRLARRFDERTAGTPTAGLWPEILAAARGA
jgi:hypothetical protein